MRGHGLRETGPRGSEALQRLNVVHPKRVQPVSQRIHANAQPHLVTAAAAPTNSLGDMSLRCTRDEPLHPIQPQVAALSREVLKWTSTLVRGVLPCLFQPAPVLPANSLTTSRPCTTLVLEVSVGWASPSSSGLCSTNPNSMNAQQPASLKFTLVCSPEHCCSLRQHWSVA